MKTLVPPIKCQGIKTKAAPVIKEAASFPVAGRWIEPFCGSCVVALNLRPQRALLADSNEHIINFYQAVQLRQITPQIVRAYLTEAGAKLAQSDGSYYYEVRERFNDTKQSLDFLFLTRSCFNGVMRFNRSGKFNVPFCKKPHRFSRAYVTKIVNQVRAFGEVACERDWRFVVADFRETLALAEAGDVVYADPPYAGRHADYFNSWTTDDETDLISGLKRLPCRFLLSTWRGNRYRANTAIEEHWSEEDFTIDDFDHFYHVGATEARRNRMVEALVKNYALTPMLPKAQHEDAPRQLAML